MYGKAAPFRRRLEEHVSGMQTSSATANQKCHSYSTAYKEDKKINPLRNR
jgi:hypothetical protein